MSRGGEIDRVGAQPPSASEKLVRVRVEFSKNRLATVRPVRMGSFLRAAGRRFFERPAVSRMMLSSSAERLSKSNRCRRVQAAGTAPISDTSVLMAVTFLLVFHARQILTHARSAEKQRATASPVLPWK